MAQSNGIQPAPRKKLVQPVLPALPLIPKIKKDAGKIKEKGKSVSNGVASEIITTADAGPAPQAASTVTEHQSDVQDDPVPASPSSASARTTEMNAALSSVTDRDLHATEHAHDDVADNKTPPEHVYDDVADNQSLPDHSTGLTGLDEVLAGVDTAESSPTKALNRSPTISAIATPPVTVSQLPRTPSGKTVESFVNGSPSAAHTAPEAVTGEVEQRSLTLHSHQHSISNSSIQLAPQFAATMPFQPERLVRNQYQLPAGAPYQALPHGLANGHTIGMDQTSPANGALISLSEVPAIPTITHHIRGLQYLPDWTDVELCVYFSRTAKPEIYRNAHSLVLIRSERLRNFIYPMRANGFAYYVVNLAPARAIDSNAFDAALKFLYEDTVLSADRLLPPTGLDKTGRIRALDYIVSYMISGLELGLEPVTTRALDLVGRLLDWDIAELALKEAKVLRSSLMSEVNQHAPREAAAAAKAVIQHIFNLIILRLDLKHFKVDTLATPADATSRLAHFESGRAVVNPALANMVFGSMPASSLSPTSPQIPSMTLSSDTVASIIMLSIDFEDLCLLFDGIKKVHGNESTRVMSDVVGERERRRLNVLNNRSISNKQRMADSAAWDIVGLREYLADGHLFQERVGFTLPTKRGGQV